MGGGKVFLKLSKAIIEKLTRKVYRDAYVAENVRTGISYQIRRFGITEDGRKGNSQKS